jgi:hypothetical protein
MVDMRVPIKYAGVYSKIVFGLLCALFIVVGTASAQVQVTNVSAERQDQELVITYDLQGEPDEKYQVALLISLDQGRNFELRPEAIRGAVGNGVSAGTGKQIIWDARQELPGGLKEDVPFRVVVEGQGRNALWYVPDESGGWGMRASWQRAFQIRRGDIERVSDVSSWQAKLGYTQGRFALRGIFGRTRVADEIRSAGSELGLQLFGKQDGSPVSLNVNGRYIYTWGSNEFGSFSQHEYGLWGRLYHAFSLGSSVEFVPSIRYDPVRVFDADGLFDEGARTVRSFPQWGWTGLGVSIGSSSFGVHFGARVPIWVGEDFDTASVGWEAPVVSGGIYF